LNAGTVNFCSESILMYRSGLHASLSKIKTEKAMEVALKTIELATECLLTFDSSEKSKKAISTQYQIYIYNVYVYHSNLHQRALKLQNKYGPNDFEFPAGGFTKALQTLICWRL